MKTKVQEYIESPNGVRFWNYWGNTFFYSLKDGGPKKKKTLEIVKDGKTVVLNGRDINALALLF
jgi:hypothetical protein